MIIRATSLVQGGGLALTSDDQLITAMVKPLGFHCGGDVHVVSDKMRHSRSVREALAAGLITVEMDASDASDFVAQVELSGFSGGTGIQGDRYMMLDIHGAAQLFGELREIDNLPYLIFVDGQASTVIWTFTLPEDYVSGTDLTFQGYWSPNTSATGDVRWRLEYKSVSPGGTVIGSPSSVSLTQATTGVANEMFSTGSSLVVPAAALASDAVISMAISRVGDDVADSYPGQVWLHFARVVYTGLRFS